jgi:hypothetical protein
MKAGFNAGSHLPVLMKIVSMTSGPILELGCGIYSTPFLYWACYPTKRRLVTYEHNPKYYNFVNLTKSDFHEVNCISNWGSIDLSESWSVAFVDHESDKKRGEEVKRLIHADYVVAHDTEKRRYRRRYGYTQILDLFKYHYQYIDVFPNTSVWSNKHDLSEFTIV